MFCTIDQNQIPAERQKRRGLAAVTCTDECYRELRRIRREAKRDKRHYVSPKKWERFRVWEEEQRQARQHVRSAQQVADGEI